MNDIVSIITPMFNSIKYIENTIISVQAQTYQNWEMIIIDDGSTDDSVKIVKSFLEEDERINLICLRDNKGSAVARNEGIKAAVGRYIAFLDSDDIWMQEKLEKQIQFMDGHKAPLSFTAYRKINENGEYLGKVNIYKFKVGYLDLLKTNHIGCLTAIMDTNLLDKKMYMPLIEKRHDHGLWLSILKQGHVAYGLNEVLAGYRCRKDSISNNKIKTISYQWELYRKHENLNLMSSIFYMISYALHGFYKWNE